MSRHFEAERRVAAVIKASVVFGVLDRALDRVWRSAASSSAASAATQLVSGWMNLDQAARRLALGTMLIAAVAAHLVWTLLTHVPPGWLWLVVPGLAAAIGLLLVAASRLPGATTN